MSKTLLHPTPLCVEENAKHGFTHQVKVTFADANPQTTAATALVVTLLSLLAGETVEKVAWELQTSFQDTTDTGNNTTTIQIKNGAASMVGATEVNANGSTVVRARTDTPVTGAAAQDLTITFGAPASGKTLSALNAGEVHVFFKLNRPATLG